MPQATIKELARARKELMQKGIACSFCNFPREYSLRATILRRCRSEYIQIPAAISPAGGTVFESVHKIDAFPARTSWWSVSSLSVLIYQS